MNQAQQTTVVFALLLGIAFVVGMLVIRDLVAVSGIIVLACVLAGGIWEWISRRRGDSA